MSNCAKFAYVYHNFDHFSFSKGKIFPYEKYTSKLVFAFYFLV